MVEDILACLEWSEGYANLVKGAKGRALDGVNTPVGEFTVTSHSLRNGNSGECVVGILIETPDGRRFAGRLTRVNAILALMRYRRVQERAEFGKHLLEESEGRI